MSDTPFGALTDALPESATVALNDQAATAALARRLAESLAPGMVIWLSGALGVGKTTLVRSLLAALGHTGRVSSPTFTLLEPYELSRFPVYHFDFYRFSAANEWRDAGFDEYIAGTGVCLVEWPELAGPDLPRPDLQVSLDFAADAPDADADADADADIENESPRRVGLLAFSEAGRQCLRAAAGAS
jgi:tRNA threonylcarbamoyladenosine biosynthesis protein TsaE